MREKISYFFHVCWYSQSAAYTSLAFGATRSGWWMNGQAFTILNTSCLSEFSRIIAAKTLKKAVSLKNNDVQTFLEGVEDQYSKRKTESCVFSGFGVSISDGWEWKSTTGRFASSRFWPFTWKTSSVGKDEVIKWEFCKLKITTIVVFVIRIQRPFVDSFICIHSRVQIDVSLVRCVHSWTIELNTRREIPYLRAPMYYSLYLYPHYHFNVSYKILRKYVRFDWFIFS